MENHHKSIAYLLEEGADREALDAFNATPLLRAVRYGAVEATEVLLNYGADVLVKDKGQHTILHRAAMSRSQSTVEFLADKAAHQLAIVEVEAKDLMDTTAQGRLRELEPTAGLLAAFTRLKAAISHAKTEIGQVESEKRVMAVESESESDDESIEDDFFNAFETTDLMTAPPSMLALPT